LDCRAKYGGALICFLSASIISGLGSGVKSPLLQPSHTLVGSLFLSKRLLLTLESLFVSAVRNRTQRNRLVVFGDRIFAKLLEIENSPQINMAPLNQPGFTVVRSICYRLAIELDRRFKTIVLSLNLVVLIGFVVLLNRRWSLRDHLRQTVESTRVVRIG